MLATAANTQQLDGEQIHAGLTNVAQVSPQPVLVRPEHVQIANDGLSAEVESCIYQGERYLLELRLRDGQRLSAFHCAPLQQQQAISVRLNQGWRLETP